jgi:cytokinin dehydrogenase
MKLTRRNALKAVAAVAGFNPIAGVWVTQADAQTISIPALDGQLLLDLPSRQAVATDFGKAISRVPVAVLKPASVNDIVKMVRFCNQHDLKIAPRGQAHTMYGQSQVRGGAGVTIDMRTLSTIHSITPAAARVDAGVIWRNLLIATVAQGLTPPVLTDYINLTIGGTLSVGGVNGTSYRQGTQIDNTLALEVVTGEGDLMTCSMTQNRDLFEAVLGGVGQCAIIVRATLKLIPAPVNARVFDMIYPTLDALMADFRKLMLDERFSYLEALMPALPTGGFLYILEGVSFYGATAPNNAALLAGLQFIPGTVNPVDQTYFAFCDRLAGAEAGLTAVGRWQLPHPWLDVFVPGSQANQYIDSVLSQLTLADVPDFPCLIYGFRKSKLTRPLLRTPDEEIFFLFDLLRTTNPSAVPAAVAQNRVFYDRAVALGGKFYAISAVPMSEQDWRRHFQPEYGRLRSAKARYDKEEVLTPGPGIFD